MRPLADKRIMITRPPGQAAPFIEKIEKAGGRAYAVPLIAFKLFHDGQDEAIIQKLHTYDWIILTSKNSVDFFMRKAGDLVKKIPAKFAAIGEKTAEAVESYGLSVSYIPKRFSADQVAKEIEKGDFSPEKALIPKGNLASSVISTKLRQAGKQADEWVVYETYFPKEEKEKLLHLIKNERIDMFTFTSPSTVRHFIKVLDEEKEKLPNAHYGCIGPVTRKEALKLGIPVSVCPESYTIEALAGEVEQFYKRSE